MINNLKSRKNKQKIYGNILLFYVFIALFAPIIANEKPLVLSIKNKIYFPAISNDPYVFFPDNTGVFKRTLTNNVDWKNLNTDLIIFPPIAFSPLKSDLNNSFSSPFDKQYIFNGHTLTEAPFRFRHFLGTGKTGNDVLAELIHGCRTSILIGFFSILIALIIGIFLGGLAGYFGDFNLKIRRGTILLSILLLIPAWFYSFYLRSDILKTCFAESFLNGCIQIIFSFVLFISIILWPALLKFSFSSFLQKKILFPIDSIISRTIEVFISLPRLILILTLAVIIKPSIGSIILIIGLTSWTETARMVRGQFLTLREMNFISAAKAIGNKTHKIIFNHMLPNVFSQLIVLGIFGICAAILAETSLSFLGIGVPDDTPTLGNLIFQAKENYRAWWLVIFSGSAIFFLLISLNNLGNWFNPAKRKFTFFNKF